MKGPNHAPSESCSVFRISDFLCCRFASINFGEGAAGAVGTILHLLLNLRRRRDRLVFHGSFLDYAQVEAAPRAGERSDACDIKQTEEEAKAAMHKRAYEGSPCSTCGKVVETGWKDE
jgi:hypothetical protein